MPATRTKGKIPRSEWVVIVRRRASGETFASIARDFGCSAPAIRYIVEQSRRRPMAGGNGASAAAESAGSVSGQIVRFSAAEGAVVAAYEAGATVQALHSSISSDIASFLVVYDSALIQPSRDNVGRLLDAVDRLMRAAARMRIELQSLYATE
jgi:hypothetical protein